MRQQTTMAAVRSRARTMSDRELVIACLWHHGSLRDVLSSGQQWEVYCLGDGFGDLPEEMLAEINSGWDWSHVRDSSPYAFARMAQRIRKLLKLH